MPGGAPIGNKNATKNKPITDAIRRVLLSNDGEKLRKLAEAMVDRAIEQSDTAAKEINDRVEGKVSQEIEHSGEVNILLAPADADA